jgi:cation transport regulator
MSNNKSMNPLLSWLWQMVSMISSDEIKVPSDYPTQVTKVKEVLESDISGIVNSILDFAINCAVVNYTIESNNETFSDVIETWMKDINISLLGKIPTGIQALSKEYYRERWKNSSLIVLRSIWETVEINGLKLEMPTKMWIVDGSNIHIKDEDDSRVIGSEEYKLKVNTNGTKLKNLPSFKNEEIFVQKPFDSWSKLYPTPFLIQRGLYKNLSIYNLINSKSEKIIGKALEYLFLMKKGSEQLALKGIPEFIYSEEDLKKVKDGLQDMLANNNGTSNKGTPTYTTNFDTQFEHLIPEYSKILNEELYKNTEKRLLAGLGMIEIVEGVSSTRKEALLNPRPFIKEVNNGIEDFMSLMEDVFRTIVLKNKTKHPKLFSKSSDIELHHAPVGDFISDSVRDHIRSLYDRGILSKETYCEVVGETDFDIEVKRRISETDNELDEIMYPPVTQNLEAKVEEVPLTKKNNKENTTTDKQGAEKKNYQGAYEEAPYKNLEELPDTVKVLPKEAQSLFMQVFNKSFPKGESYAFKAAWAVVKKRYKKSGDKWVLKKGCSETDEINISSEIENFLEYNLKETNLENAQLKNKLLKDLINKGKDNETV